MTTYSSIINTKKSLHTVGPLVGSWVELAVELTHGDGLWVDDEVLHTPLIHQVSQFEVTECVSEDLVRHRLTPHRLANDHETVAHKDHLVHLQGVQII